MMPKDAKKNVDRYKIRGGDINEFEFRQNQGQVKESTEPRSGGGAKKSAKAAKGATARKLAAKKSAKK
jgi:hypothetical protein